MIVDAREVYRYCYKQEQKTGGKGEEVRRVKT